MSVPYKILESYSNRISADLVISLLEGCGIPVEIRGDTEGGIQSSFTLVGGLHIYVPAHLWEDARAIITGKSTLL